jgi:hypothetical protein
MSPTFQPLHMGWWGTSPSVRGFNLLLFLPSPGNLLVIAAAKTLAKVAKVVTSNPSVTSD